MMPPPASTAPSGFAPPTGALPSRRPIGPLIVCIAVLLAVVATAGAFMTMRSLAAAGRLAHKPNPSMVAAGPKANPGEFVAAPQPNLNVKPPTPAANPQPAVQPPVIIKQPAEPQMPADVLAYLSWLAQQNEDRLQVEREGQGVLPSLLPQLLTGGLGVDVESREESPAPEHGREFEQWSGKLRGLHDHLVQLVGLELFWRKLNAPGSPHVPQQCTLLHGMYERSLGLQVDAVQQIAAYIAAKDAGGVSRQMEASNRAQELMARADAEAGRVCAVYKVPQWFHIGATPGTTPLPPILPR
jgi:hypothetical protein